MALIERSQAIDTIMNDTEPNEVDRREDTSHQTIYKSYKKKYRKMRLKFDDDMRKSNDLYRMEQEANATIKRIAQFNNQLLDMLLDNNSCPQVPSDKRFLLATPHSTLQSIPPLVDPTIPSSLASSLTTPAHEDIYDSIQSLLADKAQQSALCAPQTSKSLSSLLSSVPHPSAASSAPPSVETHLESDSLPLRYLTTEDIDVYLEALDNPATIPVPNPANVQELSVRNPHSVYNWLRINQPKVFLQDGEGSEKSSVKPSAPRAPSKKSASSLPAPTPLKADTLEFVEEDGLNYEGYAGLDVSVPGTGGKGKGKRKRGAEDDDTGYHPKQGRVEDGKGKKVRKPRAKRSDEAMSGGSAKRSRKSKGGTNVSDDIAVKEEDEVADEVDMEG